MKQIRIREGIVLTKVCGEYLLVATGKARLYCPNVEHINASAALLWTKLINGESPDELKKTLKVVFNLSEDKASADTEVFLNSLKETGYLLSDGES